MHKQIPKIISAGTFLAIALLASAAAQEAESEASEEAPVYDEDTVECISLRNVRRTVVVDDRNVLFYMRGKTVYHNMLPRSCGGLAREERFSYHSSMGRLCRLDQIRVLYDDPFGMREGNRCALGVFHKMDSEDARALRDSAANDAPVANPLPLPAPQEVGEDEDEDEEDPR